ncbi:MAG: hypothetical protein H6806_02670 [Planctomycetes bacterium]|nr:hypothetical protein [Planctomycetota bacterium]MCB9828657.1 hypothetical protein [Planctomycetota bacterium]MCB9901020.1 hypothetical protein [Planctomycetota bacterium]
MVIRLNRNLGSRRRDRHRREETGEINAHLTSSRNTSVEQGEPPLDLILLRRPVHLRLLDERPVGSQRRILPPWLLTDGQLGAGLVPLRTGDGATAWWRERRERACLYLRRALHGIAPRTTADEAFHRMSAAARAPMARFALALAILVLQEPIGPARRRCIGRRCGWLAQPIDLPPVVRRVAEEASVTGGQSDPMPSDVVPVLLAELLGDSGFDWIHELLRMARLTARTDRDVLAALTQRIGEVIDGLLRLPQHDPAHVESVVRHEFAESRSPRHVVYDEVTRHLRACADAQGPVRDALVFAFIGLVWLDSGFVPLAGPRPLSEERLIRSLTNTYSSQGAAGQLLTVVDRRRGSYIGGVVEDLLWRVADGLDMAALATLHLRAPEASVSSQARWRLTIDEDGDRLLINGSPLSYARGGRGGQVRKSARAAQLLTRLISGPQELVERDALRDLRAGLDSATGGLLRVVREGGTYALSDHVTCHPGVVRQIRAAHRR